MEKTKSIQTNLAASKFSQKPLAYSTSFFAVRKTRRIAAVPQAGEPNWIRDAREPIFRFASCLQSFDWPLEPPDGCFSHTYREVVHEYGKLGQETFVGIMPENVRRVLSRMIPAVVEAVRHARLLHNVEVDSRRGTDILTEAAVSAAQDGGVLPINCSINLECEQTVRFLQGDKHVATVFWKANITDPELFFPSLKSDSETEGDSEPNIKTKMANAKMKKISEVLGFYDPTMEPVSGTADSMVVVRIPGIFKYRSTANFCNITQPRTPKKAALNENSLFRLHTSNPLVSEITAFGQRHGQGQGLSEKPVQMGTPSPTSEPVQMHSHAPEPAAMPSQKSTTRNTEEPFDDALYVPVLVNEDKRFTSSEDAIRKAINQSSFNLVATATWLDSIGASGESVMGMSSNGIRRRPVYAKTFKSRKGLAILLADRRADCWSLADPIGALRVATYLAYICSEHAPNLVTRLQGLREVINEARPLFMETTRQPAA